MMGNFYVDTIQKDPRFHSTSRIPDLNLLEPVFRKKVQAILADAKGHNRPMIVFETYRSQERQEQLFHQGATQLKTVGVHHYGLAADIVFLVDGQVSWKGDFGLLGRLCKAHGLVWGGDWGHPEKPHTFRDYDHAQRVAVADQERLFSGAWYPDEGYVPR